jgi:hypothetical protein
VRSVVAARMRRAYYAESALAAEAELCALAAGLDRTHPGGAASLREGMDETLTVLRLSVPPTLARTLEPHKLVAGIGRVGSRGRGSYPDRTRGPTDWPRPSEGLTV